MTDAEAGGVSDTGRRDTVYVTSWAASRMTGSFTAAKFFTSHVSHDDNSLVTPHMASAWLRQMAACVTGERGLLRRSNAQRRSPLVLRGRPLELR
eukprot:scaffold131115_cov60-Phaeocystis_antarctica.AAC.1